ncbi:MAG: LOG family protein [Anaerolineaceae bacterium]
MYITVFGGANPRPGEEPYNQALKLGRLLGGAGHTVLTGGYGGTMEAVSRGAAETGAHVIGVTCGEIETYKNAQPNPWVKEVRHFESLIDRLTEMMNSCQAAIALPGGAGTLTEITLLWNRVIIKSLPALPIILVGPAWKTVFEQFLQAQAAYISGSDGSLLSFAATAEEASELITRFSLTSGVSQNIST